MGRGSWGVYLLLFAPVTGTAPVREVELAATSFEAALHELDGLEDRALAELLERSTPKSD